ncbi:unnamed protein product [Rodentolepis nana]|uniref:Ovule protein n=1 Tax=Rodentolepis nana TaxID=102285 RepID=A0A0R3TPJ8_RODNA|nr:unnamed protein product [Rodentolepis nana]
MGSTRFLCFCINSFDVHMSWFYENKTLSSVLRIPLLQVYGAPVPLLLWASHLNNRQQQAMHDPTRHHQVTLKRDPFSDLDIGHPHPHLQMILL